MARETEPFIPSELRPDVGSRDAAPALDPGASPEQLREQAAQTFSPERRQILGLDAAGRALDWEGGADPGADVVAQDLDGELLILDLASSEYYSLNDVGTAIWGLIVEGHTFGQIAAEICRRYDVDEQRARADLASLVGALEEKGLITRRPEARSPGPA